MMISDVACLRACDLMTRHHVATSESGNVVVIDQDATAPAVARALLEERVYSVHVKDTRGEIVGLITAFDLLRLIAEAAGRWLPRSLAAIPC